MGKTSIQQKKVPAGRKAHPAVSALPRQISLRDLEGVVDDINAATNYYVEYEGVDFNLTGKERLRLIRANVRNNGFIDKAFDLVRDNPQFTPLMTTASEFANEYRRYEILRRYVAATERANQVATDAFYQQSDVVFRLALRLYHTLRDLARSKVEGALVLFETLRSFFNRPRRNKGEPTEKQIEKDAKKLLKGKADGAMLIENQRPVTVDGEHKVIDDVRTGKDTAKVVEKVS